jgi:hypothetical protein
LTLLGIAAPVAAEPAPPPQAVEFFETKVRPVLAENCFTCHGAKRQQAGLRLDGRETLLKGSETGPVVVAGDPDKSRLIHAIRYQGELKMPPKGPLPAEAIESLTTWIKMGAPWPESANTAGVPSSPLSVDEARRKHWAFQPVRRPALPAVKDPTWAQTPLDSFILAKLEEKGLTPSPPATRRVLIRRATLDLIGLPPTPEELAAFEADRSPDAFARVLDRLLASPQYGERWGRHWLDVARYADTKGSVANNEEPRYPFAYTYRDYVIRAFNEDLPYDQFLLQQLAADLLPLGDDKRPLAAMGYLTLGPRGNLADTIDDRIDVVSRGLLGLTVACARCHDHKYDPIPQADYYSLYGVFASSTEPQDLPQIAEPEPAAYDAYTKALGELQQQVKAFEDRNRSELQAGHRKFREQLRALQRKVDQHRLTHPGAPPKAMVLVDASQPVEPRVFLRGNSRALGATVPRQFLAVLSGDDRQPFRQGSGRLELAQAIAARDNPLTARVLVNRVWMHHFGQGLVRSPSNFGLGGEVPSHPELLDYLAWRFREDGWSIKQLHRLILLSAVYQQSSADNPGRQQVDPDNHLLGKMNRQRLNFEALRDSLLAVAGRLDRKQAGQPVDLTTAPFSLRRSVYGFIDRQNLPGLFRTFDFASPDTSSEQRHQTTIPQQALFLMNSPFVIEQARHLLTRPDVAALREPEARIEYLYRLLYGRAPEARELALGRQFLEAARASESKDLQLTAWAQYAQVLLMSNEFVLVE